jgi:lambda repressor-like predicted transcriptional regulator
MNVTTRTLKGLLAARGWHYQELSKATGYAVQTLRNVACGSNKCRPVRLRIEATLGGIEIWPREEDESQREDAADGEIGMSPVPDQMRRMADADEPVAGQEQTVPAVCKAKGQKSGGGAHLNK